ncbi:hypothetical protein ACFYTQ_08625 [Nocardia sp. NPDC004068]|uniref:hypothetical protein n=1 Tax=Nocardia sp. NPDC004068 TaxID=3364303 RepID=UPI0036AA92B0
MAVAVAEAPESATVSRRSRPVLLAAAAMLVAQWAIRGWVAGRGYFYWDDLILVGRAGDHPLLSADLLLYDHDGHFMPLAFATAWLVTATAPLHWAGPVVSLLLWQAAAGVAVLRMLLILVPRARARPVVLLPFAFYLFCPLTLPAFAWWSAGLNALPLQFAMAWVIGDAVALLRTGRRRYAVSAVVVLTIGLLFFEKSVVVPFVAFAVAALARHLDGDPRPLRTVLRRAGTLWTATGSVLVCWLPVYLTVAHASATRGDAEGVRRLLHSATSLGIVPTLLGGPWSWARWLPSTPWATPPGWAVILSWLALGVVVAQSVRTRRRVIPLWLMVVGYVLLAQLPVVLIRGGPGTAAELMQSLRYLADVTVVLTAAGALLLRARPRRSTPRTSVARNRFRAAAPLLVTIAFVASSLWSTVTFANSWSISPTRTYLTNASAAVRDGTPLLDQEVPWDVLSPLTHPQNLASRVLSPVAPPGAFADSTPRLRMFTDSGALTDARIWWNRAIVPGPVPGCGYHIATAQPVDLALDGPLLDFGWTAQLNYLASRDGEITVGLEHGRTVVVPVTAGLHTVYVRLIGNGETLRIGSHTPGLDVCVGVGPVGVAYYDR